MVGGAAGIGAAVTGALARAGAAVVFCDVDGEAVAATSSELNDREYRVVGHVADALDHDQLADFYNVFDSEFDALDVLVNVVGGVRQQPFDASTRENWEHDIYRNFGYVLESISAALPYLRRGETGGSIVNFTTIEAHRGAAGFAVYAGAKAGLTNFSRALALELGPERIRVNLIAPIPRRARGTATRSPLPRMRMRSRFRCDRQLQALATYVPMADPPMPENLADAVLFLASDMSTYVTGTTVHVDGGTSAASGFQHWPAPYGWLPVVPATLLHERAFE